MKNRSMTTRRDFLFQAGLTVGCALALTDGKTVTAQASARVRPDIATLDPNGPQLQALRTAVDAFKRLPQSDPKSWGAIARIHNEFCPHSNWFFLPWHRAYVLNFEQLCREASGDRDFMLPYWNWTNSPRLPAPFWGSDNPLMNNTRWIGPNHSANLRFVGQRVLYGENNFGGILRISEFTIFASGRAVRQRERSAQGPLEAAPHNHIHGFVGGNMNSMFSPLDPIFWLHHANVDRLWTEWERMNPGRTPNEPGWLTHTLEGFDRIRPQGQAALKVSDTLSTYSFGYRYPSQPATPPPVQPLAAVINSVSQDMVAERRVPRQVTSRGLSFDIATPSALRSKVNEAANTPTATEPGAIQSRLRLIVEVEPIGDLPTGVQVFLGSKTSELNSPEGNSNYVGSFTFFGHGHESHTSEGGQATSFAFDVTRVLRKLKRAGLYRAKSDLRVSLKPFPLGGKCNEVATINLVSFRLEAIG